MKKTTLALTLFAALIAGQAMAADTTATTPVASAHAHTKAVHKHHHAKKAMQAKKQEMK